MAQRLRGTCQTFQIRFKATICINFDLRLFAKVGCLAPMLTPYVSACSAKGVTGEPLQLLLLGSSWLSTLGGGSQKLAVTRHEIGWHEGSENFLPLK